MSSVRAIRADLKQQRGRQGASFRQGTTTKGPSASAPP